MARAIPQGFDAHGPNHQLASIPDAVERFMDAYGPDLAHIHEAGFTILASSAASVILRELPPASRAHPVTDLGCGGGTFAELVSRAGYEVIGYDISQAMVEIARTRVPDATFEVASFVDAKIPTSSAVTAIGEVFNYAFDERSNRQVLESVSRRVFDALAPGGMFLFDIATPERGDTVPEKAFTTNADWTVLVENSVDGQILTRDITAFRRVEDLYRRTCEVHRLFLFDPNPISEMLTSVGFEVSMPTDYANQKVPAGLTVFHARKPHEVAVTAKSSKS